jgi:alcohol dehydrogenase class IV
VAELISDLGLPRTLGDVGIKDDQWDKIAEYGVKHPTVLTNPRPITKKGDIIEILKLAS